MQSLRNYLSLILVVLLIGCSTPKPIIIEREIPVPIPAYRDTTIVLRDTVVVQDSVWYGEVTDSLGKVIGDLTVYYKKKIASISLKERIVYVPIKDTVNTSDNSGSVVPIIINTLSWWEQTILYGGMGLILSLLIAMRVKRGKII